MKQHLTHNFTTNSRVGISSMILPQEKVVPATNALWTHPGKPFPCAALPAWCSMTQHHCYSNTSRVACTQDAAELYERAGLHERAATIYIQARAFALAAPLMALITHNPKLQLEFAKAKESKCVPCM